MIVVDASVAVKWLFDEEGGDRARALFDEAESLQAPDLLLTEVGGAIVRRVNARIVTVDDGRAIAAAWGRMWESELLQSHRANGMIVAHAIELAMQLGHPLPDCIYLALAIDLDCGLVTADRKFAQRATARHADIRIVGDS